MDGQVTQPKEKRKEQGFLLLQFIAKHKLNSVLNAVEGTVVALM